MSAPFNHPHRRAPEHSDHTPGEPRLRLPKPVGPTDLASAALPTNFRLVPWKDRQKTAYHLDKPMKIARRSATTRPMAREHRQDRPTRLRPTGFRQKTI